VLPAYNKALIAIAAVLLAATALHLILRLPMGISGEWWTYYHERFASAADLAYFAAILLLFLAAAWALDHAAVRMGRAVRALAALALTCFYGYVLFTAVTTGPLGRPEFAAPVVGSGAVSFFQNESHKVSDARGYLSGFPDRLREYGKDFVGSIRVNNNPPGTTMVFYVGRKLGDSYPAVRRIATEAVFGRGFPADPHFAAQLVGEWMLLLGAALAFLPAWLAASRLSGTSGFFPAAAGLIAGSMLLFNPNNDTLQVMLFLWMLYLFLRATSNAPILAPTLAQSPSPSVSVPSPFGRGEGVRARPDLSGRGQSSAAAGGTLLASSSFILHPSSFLHVCGLLFGLVASAAFFFSLATAIVVVVCFVAAALSKDYRRPLALKRDVAFWLSAAAGLLAGFAVLYALWGYNSFESLYVCYRNHASFYTHFPRTYWKWVFFNLWEFVMFMGGPLFAVAAWHAVRRPSSSVPAAGESMARSCVRAAFLVLLLLNFSGKNLSEVNRLWVFFMPFLAVPACVLLSSDAGGRRTIWAVAVLQIASILVLRYYADVWRIDPLMEEIFRYMPQ
jgi:hypothetical protein